MNVVIPFHNGDARLAIDLVKWIGQLGLVRPGSIVLLYDSGTSEANISMVFESCREFDMSYKTERSVSGWPAGSNVLFGLALESCSDLKGPWLWLEPDAIPLKAGWLDAIRKEYAACGKRYMGNVYVCNNPRLPNRLMSGIGVYPADAKNDLLHFTKTRIAWDVEAARFLVENCHHTKLIHHFWGIAGLPPTFAPTRTDSSPPNTFTLESIHKDAVIFHRNKDGTLMNLLKEIQTIRTGAQFVKEMEATTPIKNDAELIAKIRDSVTDW